MKSNFALLLSGVVLSKLTFPFGIYSVIPMINDKSISFIELSKLPFIPSLILTIILFDLAIYFQHVLSHRIPLLWRFHLVHHSDNHMDTSTGVRFHPVEIILSLVYKMCIIAILKPLPECYLIYEMILSSMALFNHSNLRLPKAIDKVLRVFIATPNFHTPHHSPEKKYTNSNYGNFLSLWDYIFKTYTAKENSTFGIKTKLMRDNQSLGELLGSSFKKG
jgi:sterol desaturase/sphingolipid hydroxylase (fatty acid hydroxylase superfamily)